MCSCEFPVTFPNPYRNGQLFCRICDQPCVYPPTSPNTPNHINSMDSLNAPLHTPFADVIGTSWTEFGMRTGPCFCSLGSIPPPLPICLSTLQSPESLNGPKERALVVCECVTFLGSEQPTLLKCGEHTTLMDIPMTDYYWIPLPLPILFFVAGGTTEPFVIGIERCFNCFDSMKPSWCVLNLRKMETLVIPSTWLTL